MTVYALAQRGADALEDVRYTLRTLARSRVFTVVTVSTVALGIGANTAIFSAVYGVLLRPLPYEDPGSLMRVYEVPPERFLMGFSPPDLVSFREQATLFDGFAAYSPSFTTLTGRGRPQRLTAMKVTAGFFELLGVSLQRGREFHPEEDLAGVEPVAILSHDLWQGLYGGDPDILGRTITLDGVTRTVIGIAP
ncbi:MAG: permease, partial [Gemmatimonadales bacterium]|nr:permease [Gemmatimonadales bacterium]NIN10893.1 permease [Gemmatimonadales bacterium]NIN49493.1 permease [Gemmatimonadales bacterium]NIP06957.1 permease [Gemmatimonadales bacterium]NIQ99016.1 permease [Gemmatimonadales bacterium]